MKPGHKLSVVEPIRPVVLRADSVKTLDEMVANIHAGKVTAFAIVVKEDGFSRWYAWSCKTSSDCANLLGQIEGLKSLLVEEFNS